QILERRGHVRMAAQQLSIDQVLFRVMALIGIARHVCKSAREQVVVHRGAARHLPDLPLHEAEQPRHVLMVEMQHDQGIRHGKDRALRAWRPSICASTTGVKRAFPGTRTTRRSASATSTWASSFAEVSKA